MPRYSQVFLNDKIICREIAAALDGEEFESLVEIGPGRGALTEFLYSRYALRFAAVEIDSEMTRLLKGSYPGIKIINRDFLELDLAALTGGARTAFIGNLPYDCSTPILERVLAFENLALAVFMFQKEVARRITARSGSGDYGYLSVAVQLSAQATLLKDVGAASFTPVPEVDSSVLLLRPLRPPPAGRKEVLGLVKMAFAHRRKTLVNSLALSGKFSKSGVESALSRMSIGPKARAQELTPGDYLRLMGELAA